MLKKSLWLILILTTFLAPAKSFAQDEHLQQIQHRLDSLSVFVTGLKQPVRLLVTGVSIQNYLFAIAKANNLSISVDPKLNVQIFDTFNGITAANILVFLSKKYNLDISVTGAIIYVTSYQPSLPPVSSPVRQLKVSYEKNGNILNLDLENDSLPAVAHQITLLSGKNIIVNGELTGKRVTSYISGASFDVAMDKLAYSNEFKMAKTRDGFYVFQPLSSDEELYINGDNGTSVRKAFRQSAGAPATANTGLFTKIVNGQRLISVDAVNSPIRDLVRQASQEIGISYSLYSELNGIITLHVNDIPFDAFLRLVFKGTPYTYQLDNGIFLIGERRLEGLRTFKTVVLKNRSIDTVLALIPNEWRTGVEIKEFREQNALILAGSSAQIKELENFISQLDVLVPVVLIEVTMVDVHKGRTVSTGITAGISDSVRTGGTILPSLNYTLGSRSINDFLNTFGRATSLNLGHVVPNFYVGLSALEANNNVDIRSVPKLSALNGHHAIMSIGNKRYYKDVTQNIYPSSTTTQTVLLNTYKEVNADLTIAIKPVVSGDDQVTLGIQVNISDFTSFPVDGSPPPQSTSKFETSLRVHSEDTIVLGGIERTENDDSSSGVPLLSRIPVLKWLFSRKTKTTSKVVTVLFIKSTIIR